LTAKPIAQGPILNLGVVELHADCTVDDDVLVFSTVPYQELPDLVSLLDGRIY
jgi:hypothetical protein